MGGWKGEGPGIGVQNKSQLENEQAPSKIMGEHGTHLDQRASLTATVILQEVSWTEISRKFDKDSVCVGSDALAGVIARVQCRLRGKQKLCAPSKI